MFLVCHFVVSSDGLFVEEKIVHKMDTSSDEPSLPESPKRVASARPAKETVKGKTPGIKKQKSTKTLLKVDRDSDPAIEDALSMAGTPFKKTKPIPPKLMKEMEEAAAVCILYHYLCLPILFATYSDLTVECKNSGKICVLPTARGV